ncbi:bifunctional phosphopantothenoylcysteine decarboxylase/phosphopantothenate--cysteine ligase CoaBC [Rossellomorea vietnamensis]|uniref:Coenzyme A biosynthesis bifunctional protein CoaBC n=1 Tax=Rossellomorea vietnamensis TaxID=218284 RepID=A0A5D4NS87_9BACI|nr:bifunctional phosphopantothenoylcysteine decarboxylase/phosphopantothenate--cysteine ligase CoaBC [Rossellomorea vietnamensis]TYS16338.1 bifunctional phosphopantothenoylcysteine decarboxylase/phosphopantothenate--cysteine ligase CoaBC [Rossellomorea vietnamensis]
MKGKKILLCVTGGIAVYKAAALTSKLVQAGAEVKVIMSASARQFVTPLTFQALARNEVFTDTFDEKNPEVIAHIDLADWADLVLVAPATANVIGKLAHGIGDDMVTTTLLAVTAPVWIAPAMNVHMYGHPAVQKNIQELYSFGYRFLEPSEGYLACGYVGKGRLEEPERIVGHIEDFFLDQEPILRGKKLVVTAGPTREKIDPVRFFSNRSSGKMGFALAEEAAKLGAEVTLISGPVSLEAPQGVNLISIESAEDMYNEVLKAFDTADIVIKSAAVADYKPKITSDTKMKKQDGDLSIEFERTKDILKTLGEKKDSQLLIGFAAETNNVEQYAAEKLRKKNADMIVANNITVEGAGFAGDTNIVTVFRKDGTQRELPLLTKADTAKEILYEIKNLMDKG